MLDVLCLPKQTNLPVPHPRLTLQGLQKFCSLFFCLLLGLAKDMYVTALSISFTNTTENLIPNFPCISCQDPEPWRPGKPTYLGDQFTSQASSLPILPPLSLLLFLPGPSVFFCHNHQGENGNRKKQTDIQDLHIFRNVGLHHQK